MAKYLLRFLKVFCFNNFNVEIYTDSFFNSFGGKCIVFFFFSNLADSGELGF